MKRSRIPLLAPSSGTLYDEGVTGAEVIKHNGQYYGYFCGMHQSEETILSFDLHISHGDYMVSNVAPAPCVVPGATDAFDALGVCDPAMLRYNNKFYMYYSGLGQACDMVGLAVSDDGKRFEKHVSPIGEGRSPCAVVRDDKVYLFYVLDNAFGGYDVHLSISGDGHTFKKVKDAVIEASGAGFDAKSISTPRIVSIQNVYYCFYCCDDEQKDIPKYFSIARSTDLHHWQKALRPLMERGEAGRFDSAAIWLPSVLWDGEVVHMWYEGEAQDKSGVLVSTIGTAQWWYEDILALFK